MRSAALLALALLAAACEPAPDSVEPPILPAALRLGAALSPGDENDYARVLPSRSFDFPADHGPHPEYRQEWWYITGHLDAEGGERFGFELTFFRLALMPRAQPLPGDSQWRTKQLYAAHFAVTDVERRLFHSTQRFSRGALGLAGVRGSPLRLWLDDWSLALPDDPRGIWRLSAHDGPYRLELELRPQMEPVLNGEEGFSRKSAHGTAANYYYSIPRLAVSGTLVREQQPLKITGSAWLDREWGSEGLAADEVGWDWFALQLDDGSSLMFYALRRGDGTRDPASSGTYVEPSGVKRFLHDDEVRVSVQKQWHSPRGGVYPAAWHLQAPSLGLDLQLRPVLADQELDTTPRYWEGAVDVVGNRQGASLSGRGYVELTGYATPRLRSLAGGHRTRSELRARVRPDAISQIVEARCVFSAAEHSGGRRARGNACPHDRSEPGRSPCRARHVPCGSRQLVRRRSEACR